MVRPEWSPNESYLRKFERLAFALVRTRPNKEHTPGEQRKRNLWLQKSAGLAGPFALALLVSIPYVAENSSGPIIVASLLLSAVDAALTVWCYTDFETKHGHCPGDLFSCLFNYVGEFPAFLSGWWWIQAQSAAFAACARTLSSIMESVTGRHVEKLMENILGAFTPLGAPMDILAVGVTVVPTIMCSLGMEESPFLRFSLYTLTSMTSMTIFGAALNSTHLFPSETDSLPIIPDRNLYAKILSGASLASVGFLGLYSMCNPDNMTLTQHQHFQVVKRFSLTGCVVSSVAFLFYFIESTVLNKVQSTNLWDGDPPLLWPLEGGWRLAVASLGIAALAIATFEFLIPMCTSVTKMANEGLLYRNLRKEVTTDENATRWNSMTPLVFGGIAGLEALLIDTKVLLGLCTSSLMGMHIIVCSSMLALRYQVRSCSSQTKRCGHARTRPRSRINNGLVHPTIQTRRLLTVSFLKSGLSKIPRDVTDELEATASRSSGASGSHSVSTSDRTYLMDDVGIEPIEPGTDFRRESASDFSVGSGVSGYESDTDQYRSEATDDTDIDAAVTEYQERIRVATLNGALPMNPTPATGRRVALATVALVPCCLAMAASLNRAPRGHVTGIMLAASSSLLAFLLLVVISRQPQNKRPLRSSTNTGSNNPEFETTTTQFFQYSIVPWLPATAIFLHCCLLLEALDFAGSVFAFWLSIGLIIYFSYGVVKSVAAPALIIPNERVRLGATPRQSVLSTVVCGSAPSSATTSTSTSEPYAHIDTVLIS